jgi:hypothetical protein
VHNVRDVTLGEDAHLAAFRNAIINRLRTAGWTNIAAVLRHYANMVPEVVPFIGLSLTRC